MTEHRDFIKKLLRIFVGTLFYSAGIALFLDPNRIAPGGIVGLSVILSHSIGGETGSWYFCLNIPILLLGYKKFGGRFIAYSFYAIVLNSVFTNLLGMVTLFEGDLLTVSIAGSILVGLGIGMVLKAGATTGGMDIVIKLLRQRYPAIKTSTFFMGIDIIVVVLSGIVLRDFTVAMYAFISVIVHGKVMDYVLYGGDEASMVYIISTQPERLLQRILEEMEIGATILKGHGGYSRVQKDVILCVVKKGRVPLLEEIVKQEDWKAFMVITSAKEIYGEGYKNIRLERL